MSCGNTGEKGTRGGNLFSFDFVCAKKGGKKDDKFTVQFFGYSASGRLG